MATTDIRRGRDVSASSAQLLHADDGTKPSSSDGATDGSFAYTVKHANVSGQRRLHGKQATGSVAAKGAANISDPGGERADAVAGGVPVAAPPPLKLRHISGLRSSAETKAAVAQLLPHIVYALNLNKGKQVAYNALESESKESVCSRAAAYTATMLEALGYKTVFIVTSVHITVGVKTADGQTLIVDPTMPQFFGGATERRLLDQGGWVGTADALWAFIRANGKDLNDAHGFGVEVFPFSPEEYQYQQVLRPPTGRHPGGPGRRRSRRP